MFRVLLRQLAFFYKQSQIARFILVFLCLQNFTIETAVCVSLQTATLPTKRIRFAVKLYEEGEFHRSISEILKLKFEFPETSANNQLNMYLAKNYFQLKDYQALDNVVLQMRLTGDEHDNQLMVRQIGLLETASWLNRHDEKKAQQTWEKYVNNTETSVFPSSQNIEGRIDPDRASCMSSVLPGAGFIVSKNYGRAAVSFILNMIFIGGSYSAVINQQYGVAGLLMFFEISWYFGGKKASAEAAISYNRYLVKSRQKSWLKNQFQEIGLSDIESGQSGVLD